MDPNLASLAGTGGISISIRIDHSAHSIDDPISLAGYSITTAVNTKKSHIHRHFTFQCPFNKKSMEGPPNIGGQVSYDCTLQLCNLKLNLNKLHFWCAGFPCKYHH